MQWWSFRGCTDMAETRLMLYRLNEIMGTEIFGKGKQLLSEWNASFLWFRPAGPVPLACASQPGSARPCRLQASHSLSKNSALFSLGCKPFISVWWKQRTPTAQLLGYRSRRKYTAVLCLESERRLCGRRCTLIPLAPDQLFLQRFTWNRF